MNVFHIVSTVEETDGIGQYALKLAAAINAQETRHHHVVVAVSGADERRDRSVRGLEDGIGTALAQIPDDKATLVVHLSLYGYAPRGTPTWLPRRIEEWRRQHPRARLVTMFHELFAFGPPWRSSFWLSPAQRRICRQLLWLSDHAVTNTALYGEILRRWRPDVPVTVLPVFSNVGEVDPSPRWCDRENIAVVFGRAGVENSLYGRYRRAIDEAAVKLGIERIVDIGPRLRQPPRSLGRVRVDARGVLSAIEISQILRSARYGFISCWTNRLEKSGVFAAYAAHGVVPVIFGRSSIMLTRSTRPDLHRLFINGCASLEIERIGAAGNRKDLQTRLFDWYNSHCLPKQIQYWSKIVKKTSSR